MEINIFLIFYWFLIFCVVALASIIVYHLLAYSLNSKVSGLTVSIFLVVLSFLILTSFLIVTKIDWDNYVLIL
jgi:hypothetical protein